MQGLALQDESATEVLLGSDLGCAFFLLRVGKQGDEADGEGGTTTITAVVRPADIQGPFVPFPCRGRAADGQKHSDWGEARMNILKLVDVFRSRHCFEKSGSKTRADALWAQTHTVRKKGVASNGRVARSRRTLLEVFSGLVWFG